MNKYKWSAANNAFFPIEVIDDYITSGWNLSDLIDIPDNTYREFGSKPPEGKQRGLIDGMPAWADIPPLTAAQLAEIKAINIAQAKADKTKLISDASDKIETLKDRIEAGQDKAAELKLWKSYRIALDDVDVSTAPDIKWPIAPE